jgi:hypothetical protein
VRAAARRDSLRSGEQREWEARGGDLGRVRRFGFSLAQAESDYDPMGSKLQNKIY